MIILSCLFLRLLTHALNHYFTNGFTSKIMTMIFQLIITKKKTRGSPFLIYQIRLINSETSQETWMCLRFLVSISSEELIKTHKDVLPNNFKKNIVYQIACKDCDASYVRQTIVN